ncbi:MAG: class I SAM-dependent methyltransferase [Alphaproteobacteria bacterium]|nr:class I SAM-dependent methyltransferase [Alphaproteobacteria bacterium]
MISLFSILLCFALISPTYSGYAKKDVSKNLKVPTPDENGNIPTLNKFGFLYEDVFIDPFTKDFIIYSTQGTKKILEIGAGYGNLSLEILKGGVAAVINDLEPRHLDIIKQRIPRSLLEKTEFKAGSFPGDLDFPEGSLDAVFCRVLQFLPGKDIERGLEKVMKWLKPGGRLYILLPTIYVDTASKKVRESFDKKRKAGDPWPGMNTATSDIYPKTIAYNMPETIHIFDMDVIVNALFRISFEILRVGYFDRYYRFTGETSSGKQGLGVIAVKPGVDTEKKNED